MQIICAAHHSLYSIFVKRNEQLDDMNDVSFSGRPSYKYSVMKMSGISRRESKYGISHYAQNRYTNLGSLLITSSNVQYGFDSSGVMDNAAINHSPVAPYYNT